jgi:hypothetical protein
MLAAYLVSRRETRLGRVWQHITDDSGLPEICGAPPQRMITDAAARRLRCDLVSYRKRKCGRIRTAYRGRLIRRTNPHLCAMKSVGNLRESLNIGTVPSPQQARLRQYSYNWTRLCPCMHNAASASDRHRWHAHKSALAGTALRGGVHSSAGGDHTKKCLAAASAGRAIT